jgi:Family of unknown function (DUF6459)
MTAPALAPLPDGDQRPPLRLRPVPVLEPRPAERVGREDQPFAEFPGQQVLPLEAPGPQGALSRGAAAGEVAGSDELAGDHAGDADPREWAGRFAQAALEVSVGLRPVAQLLRWACDDVLVVLGRRHALAQRAGGSPRRAVVRSVHLCLPVRGVAEAAVVVGDGVRVRALAFRMEAFERRWRVTSIEIG